MEKYYNLKNIEKNNYYKNNIILKELKKDLILLKINYRIIKKIKNNKKYNTIIKIHKIKKFFNRELYYTIIKYNLNHYKNIDLKFYYIPNYDYYINLYENTINIINQKINYIENLK